MGALAAGTGAAMGTGAFTTASIENRMVTADVTTDENSRIALVTGGDPDIYQGEDGELKMELGGSDGEGININSTYTWGDHDDPENHFAFKIVNNEDTSFDDVVLTYVLDDDSWVDHSTTYSNESFIKFTAYGQGDPDGYWGWLKCPNNQLSTPNPVSRNLPTSGPVDFDVGQELYIVIDVDTTGSLATLADDLSGSLTIDVTGPGGH